MAKAALKHFDWLDQMVEGLQRGEELYKDGTKSMGDALREALSFNKQQDPTWLSVKLVQTRLPKHEWTTGEQGGLVCFRYTLGKHKGDTLLRSPRARELEAGGEKLRRQVPLSEQQQQDRLAVYFKNTEQQKEWEKLWELPEGFLPAPVEHYPSEDHWVIAMTASVERFGVEPFVKACHMLRNLGFKAPHDRVLNKEEKGSNAHIEKFLGMNQAKPPKTEE